MAADSDDEIVGAALAPCVPSGDEVVGDALLPAPVRERRVANVGPWMRCFVVSSTTSPSWQQVTHNHLYALPFDRRVIDVAALGPSAAAMYLDT
jgi:hypothetical protein